MKLVRRIKASASTNRKSINASSNPSMYLLIDYDVQDSGRVGTHAGSDGVTLFGSGFCSIEYNGIVYEEISAEFELQLKGTGDVSPYAEQRERGSQDIWDNSSMVNGIYVSSVNDLQKFFTDAYVRNHRGYEYMDGELFVTITDPDLTEIYNDFANHYADRGTAWKDESHPTVVKHY